MQCGVWNQMKIWSSHLLDNLSNCLMNLKNSGDSTGFEPMTSAMPVQCSNQLSYEVTQKECHMKECYMQCGVWNQMKIWSSHLLDNLSNCLMNLKNSGDSTGFEPMTSAMPVQCSNQLSYEVTQWRAGQFVGLMFSRERNVIWKNVICSAVFEIKWRYDPRTCWKCWEEAGSLGTRLQLRPPF